MTFKTYEESGIQFNEAFTQPHLQNLSQWERKRCIRGDVLSLPSDGDKVCGLAAATNTDLGAGGHSTPRSSACVCRAGDIKGSMNGPYSAHYGVESTYNHIWSFRSSFPKPITCIEWSLQWNIINFTFFASFGNFLLHNQQWRGKAWLLNQ